MDFDAKMKVRSLIGFQDDYYLTTLYQAIYMDLADDAPTEVLLEHMTRVHKKLQMMEESMREAISVVKKSMDKEG